MTPRRDNHGGFNPDRLAERLEARDDALRSRIETLFDGVDQRLARIERGAATGEIERHALASELAAIRIDLGEGREATALLREELTRHVQATEKVSDTAETTAKEAKATGATLLERVAGATKMQKRTLGGVFLVGITLVITEGPGVVRFVNAWAASVAKFWEGLGR